LSPVRGASYARLGAIALPNRRHHEPLWCSHPRHGEYGEVTEIEESSVHPYFVFDVYRLNLSELERRAELQRIFNEGRAERQARNRRNLVPSVFGLRRHHHTTARATC
jgi:hypothetical protein